MEEGKKRLSPALIAGGAALMAAFAVFFVNPLLSASVLSVYVGLCVASCFLPQAHFLGPVISRGRTGQRVVALTFDDGPSEATTPKVLDLLDRHGAKAAFFVSGANAARFPHLVGEMVRRGHSIGNHSMNHDPFLMLRGSRTLRREIVQAGEVLQGMGIDALAFRPPVGIVNPKLFPVLEALGLFCVTFNCRARDAGNWRIRNLSDRILKKVKSDDIILLHDRPPRGFEDPAVFWDELEKTLAGIKDKRLRIVPLSYLAGRDIMRLKSPGDPAFF
ncbi:MAG: polysaccharide deacetylase family protein [Smithellaceae bacterium]|jgi:peptidoglycan/xylan/chitin deacetylase (PgdA/CDA1 family)|nr:polysaccharide deacetylase family protein [Smithellaceae bacterium]MDD3257944.1 polysaccharide deacetylase family protein [Smithellaceae bacterium]MDD3848336.1 polysaccharide deacetylase family protein [Smithellaceae bacterium]HOG11662.1 polysaccharide deacetylase family protein [Smithellaceae bacterium]HOQ71611.1 polysaccharide deacetylase family protein [Smithellaceae bacterium]